MFPYYYSKININQPISSTNTPSFGSKNIEILKFQQPKHSIKEKVPEKKNLFLKIIHALTRYFKKIGCETLFHELWRFLLLFHSKISNIGKLISIKLKNLDKQWLFPKSLSNLSINKTKQWTATPSFWNCDGFY